MGKLMVESALCNSPKRVCPGRALAWVAGVLLLGTAGAAAASSGDVADDPGASRAIEEVVVTARKREESLQDLPGSAAALTSGFLDDVGGIQSLRELTDKIPGITITEGQLPEVSEPSIRGAGQARNRMSTSATGIYRNGAYVAGKGLGGRNFTRADAYDLEQVEVYRGPQGALYGRNALGGAIHLRTRRPSDGWKGEVGLVLGENERTQYEVLVNAPITESFSSRFSFVRDEFEDGFYDDADGNPVDTSLYEHARGSFRLDLDRWEVNYVYDYMDDQGTPAININPNPAVREANDDDVFQTLINSEHSNRHEVHNHSLQIDLDMDAGTVSWVANYRDRKMGWVRDPDHGDGTINQATRPNVNINETREDLLYHEFRFVSDGSRSLRWLLGADYYDADTSESIVVLFPQLSAATLNRFNDPTGLVYDSFIDVQQESWAVFGQVEYSLDSVPLTLSTELRYAVDDIGGDVAIYQPYQGCAQTLGQPPCTSVEDDQEYRNSPWTITASWAFEELPGAMTAARAYAKVGTSYRHGGLNLSAGLPSNAFPVKPTYGEETSITYEIGVKTGWLGDRLRLNADVFLTEYEDFLNTTTNGCPELCPYLDPETFQPLGFNPDGSRIETTQDGDDGLPSGTAFFIDNIGDVEAWGYEVEMDSSVSVGRGQLHASLGYSRQLGEIESIRPDVSPANVELEGERLNRLRPKQFKATTRYHYPLGGGLFRGVSAVAVASWVVEKGGIQELPQAGGGDARYLDDVSRLDIRVGLESRRWELFIEGNNVTDEEYVLNENGAGVFRINDPALYAVSFKWRFN